MHTRSINLDSDPEEEVIEFYDEKGELMDRLMTPEALIIEDAIKAVLQEKQSKKMSIIFLPRDKQCTQ